MKLEERRIKELSSEEFKKTFGTKMTDVTETAEPLVDIWGSVEELAKGNIVDRYVFERNLVERVYRNNTFTFDHVLLPTKSSNIFIVIVVDLTNKSIPGYSVLDLNKEYGIEVDGI